MEVLYPRCAGLDVHKKTVVACVRLMEGGPPQSEIRTFGTTTADLLNLSTWLSEKWCTHVVMEATGIYWRPIWHILSDGEFELTLANAAHVKNVPGRKTDVKDCAWLADLMAHGLIKGSFVPDTQTQEMRTLLRTRKQLVREPYEPYPAAPQDARERQHQAGFRHLRHYGQKRPRDDRGHDCGGNRRREIGQSGQSPDQSLA
jgi:transposase